MKKQITIEELKKGSKVNPKILRKGLKVKIIRGRNKNKIGEVIYWEGPIEEDPNYQINVKVNNSMSYLGLGDVRLV